ncbi:MAG: hypothetical protein LKJ86_02800 [Oscillibacter sp.]|nr:hypothetical protein [Oscillibacter sp.]
MINVWEYANDLPRVKVVTESKDVFEGRVIQVIDSEEIEEDEDYISVEANDGEIKLFSASEISAVERIN